MPNTPSDYGVTALSVIRPIPCPEAFRNSDPSAHLSQAALLLHIGWEAANVIGHATARSRGIASNRAAHPTILSDELTRFPLPMLDSRTRVARKKIQPNPKGMRSGTFDLFDLTSASDLHQLAIRLYQSPTVENASDLTTAALNSESPLVRVAAAASAFDFLIQVDRAWKILTEALDSADTLVRDVAAVVVGRLAGDHPELTDRFAHPGTTSTEPEDVHTTLIVHGTFARREEWWQPDGSFHKYLKATHRPDTYSAADRFDWSGLYSHSARVRAAADLSSWVARHQGDGLDIVAHSHGGNVGLLATMSGQKIRMLVLLSTPAHLSTYRPDWKNVSRVVCIRVHMDLVVLADRGRQSFQDKRIEQHVLPLWFAHSASHDPRIWDKYNLGDWLT